MGGQLLVLLRLGEEVPVMEAAITVCEFVWKAAHGGDQCLSSRQVRRCQIVQVETVRNPSTLNRWGEWRAAQLAGLQLKVYRPAPPGDS
jgi:hypothetical protein